MTGLAVHLDVRHKTPKTGIALRHSTDRFKSVTSQDHCVSNECPGVYVNADDAGLVSPHTEDTVESRCALLSMQGDQDGCIRDR